MKILIHLHLFAFVTSGPSDLNQKVRVTRSIVHYRVSNPRTARAGGSNKGAVHIWYTVKARMRATRDIMMWAAVG